MQNATKTIRQPKAGSKEAALREMRGAGKRRAKTTAPAVAIKAPDSPAAQHQETDVTKKTKKMKTKAAHKPKAKRKPAARKTNGGTPAQLIADHMARDGGASMDELVKKFGIEAHPMRSKIFFVRHTLGYDVEHKDGRYHATAPKKAAA